jgi:hypothetical protein
MDKSSSLLSALERAEGASIKTLDLAKAVGCTTKKDVNHELYELEKRGLIEKTADSPPAWSLKRSGAPAPAVATNAEKSDNNKKMKASPLPLGLVLLCLCLLHTRTGVEARTDAGADAGASACFVGSYRVFLPPYNSCAGFRDCPRGSYCVGGVKRVCPAGRY